MTWNLAFFINSVLFGVGLAMDAFSVSMANGLNEPKMKKNRMCLIAGTFCGFQILMPLVGWLCVHTIAQIFTSFQKFIPWIALILLAYIGGKMLIEGIHDYKEGKSTEAGGVDGASMTEAAGTISNQAAGAQAGGVDAAVTLAQAGGVDEAVTLAQAGGVDAAVTLAQAGGVDGARTLAQAGDVDEATDMGGGAAGLVEKSKLTIGALMVQGIATAIDALSVGFTIAEYSWIMALVESLIIGVVTFVICIGGLVIGKTVGDKLSGKASILGGVILIGIGLEIFITGIF